MAFTITSADNPTPDNSSADNSSVDNSAPMWVAADTHNIANNGTSFWDDPLGELSAVPKFVGLGIASGVNQLYNIAPTIGNWFGGDYQQNKLADTLSGFDTNLSQYYVQHQQGIDALGFAVSSLVPGSGGVKVLRAGQEVLKGAMETGVIGGNLAKATGLLVPSAESNVLKATSQLINNSSPFSLQNASVLKSLAAGFGQATLEGAAFETAVAATMYNSPVLEKQDFGDIVSNIVWGAGLFGTIGGALEAAKSIGAIKKGLGAFDSAASPHSFIEVPATNSSASDSILLYKQQLDSLKQFTGPIPEGAAAYPDKIAELTAQKATKLGTLIRAEAQTVAGGDTVVADMLHRDIMAGTNQDTINSIWELNAATRLSVSTTGDKLLNRALAGKATLAEAQAALDYSTSYLYLRGDAAGKVVNDIPMAKGLIGSGAQDVSTLRYVADTIKPGEEVTVLAKTVKIGNKSSKIGIADKNFDLLKANHIDTELRTAWARKYYEPAVGDVIASTDIPVLDAAYEKVVAGAPMPLIKLGDITYQPANAGDLLNNIADIKQSVAVQLAKSRKLPQDVIAKMVNVKSDWLSGTTKGSLTDNIFADAADLAAHNERTGQKLPDLLNTPSVLKLSYKTANVKDLNGFVLDGMTAVQTQQRLYANDAARAVSSVLAEAAAKLPEVPIELITKANRMGAGATFTGFASGNYGSLGSIFEWIGKVTTDIISSKRQGVRNVLEPLLYKLQNDQEAAIEWSKLMQTVRGSEHNLKLVSDDIADGLGGTTTERYLTIADDDIVKQFVDAGEDVPRIDFKSPIVSELAAAHVELNGARVDNLNILRGSQGLKSNLSHDTFYAPAPNPKDYPYFAFVIDPTITGTGHSRMLYASSETDLRTQMTAVRSQYPEFKVLEKGAAEEYYKSVGQFDYEKTLNNNYMDSAVKRTGVSAPFLIKTDPKQIADEMFQWHLNAEAGVVREAVSHNYEAQFEALRKLGENYTRAATSKYGNSSIASYAENTVQNPFSDYIKTALGINKSSEYPFWMPVQKMLDNKVSQLFDGIKRASVGIKSPEDLKAINTQLQEAGYKGAYYDAALNSAVNTAIPKGALTSYVQASNGLLSLFALRLDPLNALNNVIGSNVLRSTEISSLLRNIKSGNSAAAGELTKLMDLTVPGTDKQVLTHGRLLANAIKDFHSGSPEMHQWFKDKGFTTTLRQEYVSSLDTMALKGNETISDMANKEKSLIDIAKKWTAKGEKYTGNAIAEELNRFTSAHVMKQITDIAVKHGIIQPETALSYINTFVNRTEGNFLAAQRPMMFQGPIGQAVGLFQTYQFNLMQNLFRHVAEGSKKDVAMLLGLQGSIFGMNGLPAFNAINTHIIGTASGNTAHTDLYSTLYSGAGKNGADWLMYGLASNMFLDPDLKLNIYTRGDINPRSVTVIPTNIADIPAINSQAKFFGNIFNTLGKAAAGGNVSAVLLQGIEHNGVSRPLAGLAETMEAFTNPNNQAYTTSSRGNVVGSNDLFSLMTLGRLAGGKPLDEAIAQDGLFRLQAYASHNAAQVNQLGAVVKSTIIGGGKPTPEQLNGFMDQYVASGGKQAKFNQFMLKQYAGATKSQAEQVRDALTKPYAETLQKIMGGYDPTPTVTTE